MIVLKTVKRFLEWIKLKEKLHILSSKPPLFKESEIWWCSLGENIGREINGKSDLFSRPVLIFKKLSSDTFLGLPTTSQDRKGSWYVEITYGGKIVTVILSQARVLDYKRLSSIIGKIDSANFKKVKVGFRDLFLPK